MVMSTGTGWDSDEPNRFKEYHALYGGTAWFAKLVKAEAIRLASIPWYDPFLKEEYTSFQCGGARARRQHPRAAHREAGRSVRVDPLSDRNGSMDGGS
jgi:hypothetical protein